MLSSVLPMTPPSSDAASPDAERDREREQPNTFISVSTTFFLNAHLGQPTSADIALLSSDYVFFYVHSHVLASASQNDFNSLLQPKRCTEPASLDTPGPQHQVIAVAEASPVLNVVVHTAYSMSCAHYSPDITTLQFAINALRTYGIPLTTSIAPNTPLYNILLSLAPVAPLDVYALAAANQLEELAVAMSPHLLSLSLPSVTDEIAVQIGPIYLKRLFFLHLGRCDALKRMVLSPPRPHTPTVECDLVEQKKVPRAWAMAIAYLMYDASPDMPCSTLESSLTPLTDHLWCDLCRKSMNDRIKALLGQWSKVKRTI